MTEISTFWTFNRLLNCSMAVDTFAILSIPIQNEADRPRLETLIIFFKNSPESCQDCVDELDSMSGPKHLESQ